MLTSLSIGKLIVQGEDLIVVIKLRIGGSPVSFRHCAAAVKVRMPTSSESFCRPTRYGFGA